MSQDLTPVPDVQETSDVGLFSPGLGSKRKDMVQILKPHKHSSGCTQPMTDVPSPPRLAQSSYPGAKLAEWTVTSFAGK